MRFSINGTFANNWGYFACLFVYLHDKTYYIWGSGDMHLKKSHVLNTSQHFSFFFLSLEWAKRLHARILLLVAVTLKCTNSFYVTYHYYKLACYEFVIFFLELSRMHTRWAWCFMTSNLLLLRFLDKPALIIRTRVAGKGVQRPLS